MTNSALNFKKDNAYKWLPSNLPPQKKVKKNVIQGNKQKFQDNSCAVSLVESFQFRRSIWWDPRIVFS